MTPANKKLLGSAFLLALASSSTAFPEPNANADPGMILLPSSSSQIDPALIGLEIQVPVGLSDIPIPMLSDANNGGGILIIEESHELDPMPDMLLRSSSNDNPRMPDVLTRMSQFFADQLSTWQAVKDGGEPCKTGTNEDIQSQIQKMVPNAMLRDSQSVLPDGGMMVIVATSSDRVDNAETAKAQDFKANMEAGSAANSGETDKDEKIAKLMKTNTHWMGGCIALIVMVTGLLGYVGYRQHKKSRQQQKIEVAEYEPLYSA